MMTRKMNRLVQMTLLGSALLSALWLGGCKDRCDWLHDRPKCEANRVMECDQNYQRWVIEMDCSDYDATCTETRVSFDFEDQGSKSYTRGCAVPTITCGDTEAGIQKCAQDGSYIAMCGEDGGNNAVVILDNRNELPYCVEHSDGHAGFAFAEGECLEGESMCMDDATYVVCEDGIWAYLRGGSCDQERLNRICTQETGEEGFRTASCEFAEPCSGETGEYDICKEGDMLSCRLSNSWFWMRSYCYEGATCVALSETAVTCQ